METAKAESHGGAVLAVPVKGLYMDHTFPRETFVRYCPAVSANWRRL